MNQDASPKISRKALEVEQARLARFFETINKHRKALDLAVEQNFDGELDAMEWRKAFESSEPDDANRTMLSPAIIRRFSTLMSRSSGRVRVHGYSACCRIDAHMQTRSSGLSVRMAGSRRDRQLF